MVTLGVLVALPYLIPRTDRLRLLSPKPSDPPTAQAAASDSASAPTGAVKVADEATDHPELELPQDSAAASARTAPPPRPVEDATGHALDSFLQALWRVECKEPGARVKVLHYGDSLLAIDYVSSTLRRLLQERFGDAGHGFMPIANPTPGYFHNDVVRRASDEWTVSRVVGPFAQDGLYGLGGFSFVGTSRAAWSRFATSSKGPYGRAVSRFGVQYLAQPSGGDFEVVVDKTQVQSVSSASDSVRLATYERRVNDGEHNFELRVVKGPVRAFGVWMDREGPGVIVDSLGIQGCRLRFLDQAQDGHWAEALRSRDPQLVIFEFGLNEAADDFAYPMDRYKVTAQKVLEQVRAALPQASCLVVAPNDVAIKRGTDLTTRAVVPHLVQAQRQVAEASGCAFFDTYSAMGGFGSMATWIRRGLGGADNTHPNILGADLIGTWLYRALMDRYEARGWPKAPLRGAASASQQSADR
jgi:lysophospholipase L1-like esterase